MMRATAYKAPKKLASFSGPVRLMFDTNGKTRTLRFSSFAMFVLKKKKKRRGLVVFFCPKSVHSQ